MYNKVYIEITNICNKNCSFCPGHTRTPQKMTPETFRLILDKLTTYTQYIYYHLMGEPLTHPLLPEFIRMANDRGFKSIITTNGTLLRKRSQELLSSNIHKINISLHSFEDQPDSVFDTYIRELSEFAVAAAQRGTIVSLRLWNKGFDQGRNDVALSLLQKYIPGQWTENSRGLRIRDKLFLEWGERFAWPDTNAQIQGDTFYCYGLKDQFGILADGTVVPCCLDHNGDIALGNILEEDLASILNSPRATAIVEGFRRKTAAEELCKRCGFAQMFV